MSQAGESPSWEQVEPILDAALEAPARDRGAVVRALCGADPALRREVESLLEAGGAAAEFLEAPAAEFAAPYLAELPADDPAVAGERVGPYRLLEELGRGGMGAVYLAERADGQFEQRVAVKLLKRGMDTDEIVSRFLSERQILARLRHPHIAGLLDGGVTRGGLPYFVMEYIQGTPITEYCDRRALPVDERLRLFQTICAAVQYAHRNLVVHRDLKPSNVLVDRDGRVKLLDFGIAKLLARDGDALTATLAAGGRFLTPEYASPEQARRDAVTTASDVYQLGLLLYELLTGRRAQPLRRGSPAELQRAICERQPTRPSTAAATAAEAPPGAGPVRPIPPAEVARRRATSPARLRRRLRGDLDTIVLTALRKEPERRYPSAEALAEDLGRHLAGQPLRAVPASTLYRARKFAGRHRIGLAAAATLAFLMAGFGGLYTLQTTKERDRARLEAVKATQSAELFQRFFENWDPDAADRAEVGAGDLLRVSVLRTEREMGDQPEVQAAMLSLLGGLFTNLGRLDEADSLLAVAEARQRRLHAGPHADLAATLERRGRLFNLRGAYVAAEGAYREAIAAYVSLFGASHSHALQAQLGLADVLLQGQERFEEAEALYRRVLRLHGNDPADPSFVYADATRGLGLTLFYQARYGEAEAILRPSLERSGRLFGENHPVTALTMQALAATVRDRGRVGEGVRLQREVVRIRRRLYGEDHRKTLFSRFVLAFNLHRAGSFDEAAELIGDVVEWSVRRNGPEHPQTGRYVRLQGYVLLDLGREAAAERLLRRSLAIYRDAYAHRHADETGILNRLAYVLVERGASDAPSVYAEALALHRDLAARAPSFVTYGPHYLARAMQRMGEHARAERLYRESLTLYRAQLPPGHPYVAQTLGWLGETEPRAREPAAG